MANLGHALEPGHSLVVNLVSPEQIGVIAEVAQEPAEFPQRFGSAIDAGGKAACGELSGLFDRKDESQKGFVSVGAIGGFLDADEKESVGNFLFLGGGGLV